MDGCMFLNKCPTKMCFGKKKKKKERERKNLPANYLPARRPRICRFFRRLSKTVKIKQQVNHSCRRATLRLDVQEFVRFAQHTGGSYCESLRYRCFLKTNVFRLDLKEARLGASGRGSGREFQVTGSMYEKARFLYLLSLMRGAVTRPAGRLIEREISQVGRRR